MKETLSPWMTLTAKNQADNNSRVYEIDIDGVIGYQPWDAPEQIKNSKAAMKTELIRLGNLQADEIIVNINSPGGNFWHATTIHDLLAEHSATVTTRIIGIAASAATIVAQAGKKRLISDNALYLIHYAWDFEMGNKFAMQSKYNDLDKMDSTGLKIYTKRSGTEAAKLTQQMDKAAGVGEWITAEEAKALGLVDEIFEPMSAAACAEIPAQMSKYFPALPAQFSADNTPSEPEMNKFLSAFMKFFKTNTKNTKEESDEMTEEQFNKFLDAQNKTNESIANLTKAVETSMQKPADPPAQTPAPAAQQNAGDKSEIDKLLDAQSKTNEALNNLSESMTKFLNQEHPNTTQQHKNMGDISDYPIL